MIATLSVLAWAATASAECAWVLWGAVSLPNVPGQLSRYAAYEMRDECIRNMKAFVGSSDRDTTVVQNATGWTVAFKSGTVADYQCWPDTVDPREAKGK